MKFTNGFWLNREGVTMLNAMEVRDVAVAKDELTVYAASKLIVTRGNTMGAPLITLTIKAPRAGILSIRAEHNQGLVRKEPRFELHEQAGHLKVSQDGETITVESGALSAVIQKKPFALDFFENGERLTGLGSKHLGHITSPDGKFMRARLDVGVGEKIYGLGERFTPFVKNGQVVDLWNEDGGTASEISYKNIPLYVTNRGYGVFVNSSDLVSYELCSEIVTSAQFSVPGESIEFMLIGGGSIKRVIENYTALTGRPALPPAWSFGLWLTTSFTTDYDEATINSFVDGMAERDIPLHVFHFDCFWMKEYEWCNLSWDEAMFPDAPGMLKRLRDKGLRVCVWINPYIGQKSPLFREGMQKGYLIKRSNGDVWQWDMWQSGMGLVDFTNPDATKWYQSKLKALMDMGVDTFKTDFGERIPTDCVYFDGSDPHMMHNYYTHLYNQAVFSLLQRERGEGEACVFARSATAGGQQFPVHWGGDSTSNYASMAESLRAGLSLMMSGFSFWSHDISGFEDMASPDVYKRWAAFGLLSTHSRLHGSSSYRVPWLFDDEASDVLRYFTKLKCRLMPYLFDAAVRSHETGSPSMRPMVMEFADDPATHELDLQYMLGDSILVAPVFRQDGTADYYLPKGKWTHLLTGEVVEGGGWRRERYDFMSLPLFVRENSLIAMGKRDDLPDYDYLDGLHLRAYQIQLGCEAVARVCDAKGKKQLTITASSEGGKLRFSFEGNHNGLTIEVVGQGRHTVKPGETTLTV